MKRILICFMMMTLLFAGCSKKVAHVISQNEQDPTQASSGIANDSKALQMIYMIENQDQFLVTAKSGDKYYKYSAPIAQDTLVLSQGEEIGIDDLMTLNDEDEITTQIKPIDGYMKGTYYATRLSDTKSTIVFVDEELSKHLDLFEMELDVAAKIIDVTLLPDFSKLYYTVLTNDKALVYEQDLATNTSKLLSNDTTIVGVDTATGNILSADMNVSENQSIVLSSQAQVAEIIETDEQVYDVVIQNGIVTDPETRTYKFGYNVGIIGDTIMAISKAELTGNEVIDAKGLIVSPGFIDMLAFNLTATSAKYKITDGVTTSLSMHGCTNHFDEFFQTYGANPPYINYGGAVFAILIRYEAGLGANGTPTQEQIQFMAQRVREEIEAGGLALSFSPEYYPGTTPEEIRAMMAVAAEYDIPTHFHSRYSSISGPEAGIVGVEEILGYAKELNARVHFMHLHSTGGTNMMDEALALIDEARAEGSRVTFDIYPYDSWISQITWARYRDGWQERYGIDYEDLQIPGTPDRLTEETFNNYKSIGGLCIAYAMHDDEIKLALSQPDAMVGSDETISKEGAANDHFRGAGTFSKILGQFVREDNTFSLMDGITKMTFNSAKHLQAFTPSMAVRGRMQVGCIADITIFDYRKILDQSTAEQPATQSIGINYVLVSGQVGVNEGELVTSVHAGQPIRSEFN